MTSLDYPAPPRFFEKLNESLTTPPPIPHPKNTSVMLVGFTYL